MPCLLRLTFPVWVALTMSCTPSPTSSSSLFAFRIPPLDPPEAAVESPVAPLLSETLTESFEHFAICPELDARTGGLAVYSLRGDQDPKSFATQNCGREVRRALHVATFHHTYGCGSPENILLKGKLSRLLEIPQLFPRSQPTAVTRQTIAAHAKLASRSGSSPVRKRWSLMSALFHSAQLAEGHLPDQRRVHGALIHHDADLRPFREFEAAARSNRSFLHSGSDSENRDLRWVAEKTPTWRKLSSSRYVFEEVSQTNRKLAIQEIELMGDLADYVVISALTGDLSPRTRLALKLVYYTSTKGKLIPVESRNDKKAYLSFKRLHALEPNCRTLVRSKTELRNELRNVRHMRPSTFLRLQKLNQDLEHNPSERRRWAHQTGLQGEDWRGFREQLRAVTQILSRACRIGSLKLDLDLESFLKGKRASLERARRCS